mmetsp:Transcript_5041/g.12287  ORF Transcript_5041/g.12287 Transcript_5041/m.12287 type:complete len:554 (-) Transcript_5041:94-1755(-)
MAFRYCSEDSIIRIFLTCAFLMLIFSSAVGARQVNGHRNFQSHPVQSESFVSAEPVKVSSANSTPTLYDVLEDCEPQKAADKCSYVRSVTECLEDNQLVSYLEILYCHNESLYFKAVAVVLWTVGLFYTLGQVADHFLCPALQFISNRLKMPSDIAGITLLAFANGAPDVFTEIAAITSGRKVDMGLAVSVTLGSGLCICEMIFALIVLIRPVELQSSMRAAYLRDTTTYMLTCVMVMVFVYDELFTLADALLMICSYVAYIVYACATCSPRLPDSTMASPAGELKAPQPEAGVGSPLTSPVAVSECVSLRGMAWWEWLLAPMTLPIKLLLNVTMPVVKPGAMSERHATAMCIAAPLFSIGVLGFSPWEMGIYPFALMWLGISGVLMFVLQAAVKHVNEQPLRENWLFAVIAFFQCILWMNLLADELVAFFHAVGHAFGISQELLGGTVLAWGECTADLVASLAIARSGRANMALSACFGCPILNLLGGMGAGLLYQIIATGPVQAKVSKGIYILGACSVLLLLYQMLAVPYLHRWNLSRQAARARTWLGRPS